jgi:translation initiation factor 1A
MENKSSDFGDFEIKGQEQETEQHSEGPVRVRTPRGTEVLGKVEQRAGANRMIVSCFDGKTRNCRIPGRLRRRLWVRQGNIVLVQPWEFEGDSKGDLLFTYKPAQIQWLERKGFLKNIEEEF